MAISIPGSGEAERRETLGEWIRRELGKFYDEKRRGKPKPPPPTPEKPKNKDKNSQRGARR